jgi:hypothetical protein
LLTAVTVAGRWRFALRARAASREPAPASELGVSSLLMIP